jgi:class 3 adenylate cyclase
VGWETSDEIAAVVDATGAEDVAVVAVGYAGGAAISYAVGNPERVSSLVLVNSFAFYGQDDDFPLGLRPEWVARMADAESASMLAGDSGYVFDLVAPSRASDDRLRQWFDKARRLYGGQDMSNRIGVRLFQKDYRPLLAEMRVPTLVLHRRGNRYIRVEAGRYLADHIVGAKYVELPGEDHLFFAGDVDALVDEIEEFLTGTRQPPEGDVVIATVLFTDIVNSTGQQARLGHRGWTKLMDEHDLLVRAALKRHRGREIQTTGDGFLATFDGGARGLRCAVEIVAAARTIGLELRAGLHGGEVENRGADVSGLAVTIAKRICDAARPGEVLASSAMPPIVAGSSIHFSDRGDHDLKGVPGKWRLYFVEGDQLTP